MRILSGIKKVGKILEQTEVIIYDNPNGREQTIALEKERIYVIPSYQREIRWESDNVQMLIDDLKKGSKFLGTITLSTCKPHLFDVIDGQQRITVITLLLTFLNNKMPVGKRSRSFCKIENKSFPVFNQMLEYQFDYERVKKENKALYDELEKCDPISQDNIKKIWNSIVERVEFLSETEKKSLYTNLLESDLNIIVNETEGTDTQQKFCADYFIDINNKGVALDSLDIIRAYAFKEDFSTMTKKWSSLQDGCNELKEVVKYSKDALFFQYFICRVNREVEYKLTKLAEDYTIKENVIVRGKKYDSGTHIWTMFNNDSFYSGLLSDLNEYIDFIKLVVSSENGGNDEFKRYFEISEGGFADETSIWNAHTIINSILRNDDMVPKMMVMKYYLEVLKPKTVKKKKYRIINRINVIANIFTMSRKRKGSAGIVSKLIQEKWEIAILDYSNKCALEIPSGIDFSKIALSKKTYTVESGQYMAKRYFSMMDSYKINNASISNDQEAFKNANHTSGEKNIEHFAINRQYTYAIYQADDSTIDIEITAPRKIKKYIATIANYLVLNSKINSELSNRPVYEKIELLQEKIESMGIDVVIPSERSRLHYFLYKQILHDESVYPKREILACKKKKDKRALLKKYYQEDFEKEFLKLSNVLSEIELLEAAKLKLDLLRAGYACTENVFNLEGVCCFTNVCAKVDLINGVLIMGAELISSRNDGKTNEDEKLTEKIKEKFVEIFEQEPQLKFSDESRKSVYYYLKFYPNINNVQMFVDKLRTIACN